MAATVDTIRATFTYATAFVMLAGGFLFLFLTSASESADNEQLIVSGLMGAAATFLFSQETATRTARASQAAHREGATLHANGLTGTPVAPAEGYPGGTHG